MSDTRVAETVWPWRQAGDAPATSPAKPVRVRAVIEALVMTAVALTLHFKFHKEWAPRVVLTLAVLTLVGGLFIPPLYHGIHRAALRLGRLTAVGLTWILLVPFFYLCFPTARLILLLSGKDPLHRALEPGRASYWTAHMPVKDRERYQRQF